ncbi:uncharacterized protein A4U43_C07F34580 [Asparagus officinalis]|uniref:Uncharacterized protein n=1 Tax=Asparagus officinalis TaxID=4686 RepID=A0A5P1EJ16_ASPOF|nr:uncharacterized protein A4U43_C07F34580 [Asparagus officinalis]
MASKPDVAKKRRRRRLKMPRVPKGVKGERLLTSAFGEAGDNDEEDDEEVDDGGDVVEAEVPLVETTATIQIRETNAHSNGSSGRLSTGNFDCSSILK